MICRILSTFSSSCKGPFFGTVDLIFCLKSVRLKSVKTSYFRFSLLSNAVCYGSSCSISSSPAAIEAKTCIGGVVAGGAAEVGLE